MKVTIRDVSVVVDGARLVDGVTVNCAPGAVIGLLGPNGSGKSTVLKTVYRAMNPTSGSVLLDDTALLDMPVRTSARHVAALVQEQGSDFDFTVHEVVATGRIPHKRLFSASSDVDRAIVDGALETVGMSGHAAVPYARLSGGEKQRVLLAKALAQQPDVLLLDEPTNHLDIATQLDLLRLIAGLQVTTVAALHDLNLAAAYCTEIYILRDGEVRASGTPSDVLTESNIAAHFGVRAYRSTHPVTGKLQLSLCSLEDGIRLDLTDDVLSGVGPTPHTGDDL